MWVSTNPRKFTGSGSKTTTTSTRELQYLGPYHLYNAGWQTFKRILQGFVGSLPKSKVANKVVLTRLTRFVYIFVVLCSCYYFFISVILVPVYVAKRSYVTF